MRGSGKTFRQLLTAILAVSLNDDKHGVVFYVANYRMVKDMVSRTIGILNGYGMQYDLQYSQNTFSFPNGKKLQFKSMLEPKERSYGIDWTKTDEMADHYIPNDNRYNEYFQGQHYRKMRMNMRSNR